ncbi:hypothetical protein [Rugosimonospora africana]|uniref:Uncharacterized protein n=1 Tax=Rugosimonospora africana TaxID=556532 RepID=A0A8J3QTT0_9ACTN|nr:hypothetical protein [Rugosimonospora africana]GIH16939.1 hypothetical protein Raf01_51110 [Rugosimonospora africana]
MLAIAASGIVLYDPGLPSEAGAAPAGAATLGTADLWRAPGNEVSRDLARDTPPVQTPTPSPTPAPSAPARPPSVPGLSQVQTGNAVVIVAVAQRRGLPHRAMVIGIATALQESSLRNLANRRLPASLALPHQAVGSDHDSVGLFQQRTSQGWGQVARLMDPAASAGLFFDRLVRVRNWQSISVAAAAQAVQRSAYPSAYRRHQALAERVVEALT